MPELLHHARYPRANRYDAAWVIRNQMGPNALWLAESLGEIMTIEPGMRVLDLGCGRAMSSIFIAREFGAQVWATDLWIPAAENQERIVEAGLTDQGAELGFVRVVATKLERRARRSGPAEDHVVAERI